VRQVVGHTTVTMVDHALHNQPVHGPATYPLLCQCSCAPAMGGLEDAGALDDRRSSVSTLQMQCSEVQLPICQYATRIAQAVKDHTTVVVIGETGSGKTTQISQVRWYNSLAAYPQLTGCRGSLPPPSSHLHCQNLTLRSQILLDAGLCPPGLQIAVTQPRRVVRVSCHRLQWAAPHAPPPARILSV
jgi:hypothetical protein